MITKVTNYVQEAYQACVDGAQLTLGIILALMFSCGPFILIMFVAYKLIKG